MHNFIESIENDEIKYLEFKLCFWGMGKVLEGKEELGKPILWGMGWVNRRLGSFGGHPVVLTRVIYLFPIGWMNESHDNIPYW